ncbi:hypothetical protein J2Z69_003671 [Paenibacillus shirakamiensis]|uniref:Uncharacterized protein n=1 Tax=Paenibacillus shirakamiensis TaxID=1265935 RepID=A0ABS4JN73_9BACL|nr:hypothetical protein [Paenibacillus shirakamiensis]MBP2002585.1 hypothetical protein [Paenibacillus shirakamiensis]
MKKRIISIVVTTTIITGVLVYFNVINHSNSQDIEPATANVHDTKTISSGDLAEGFETVDELKNSSEVIVEVEADKGTSFEYNHAIFTSTRVKINKIYKGELNVDYIKVLETGGFYHNSENVLEGNYVLQSGEKAILFLDKYIGPVTSNSYVVKGAYQGKFVFVEGSDFISGDNKGKFKENIGKFGELQQVHSIDDLKLNN